MVRGPVAGFPVPQINVISFYKAFHVFWNNEDESF
jgi:hypothetical protein